MIGLILGLAIFPGVLTANSKIEKMAQNAHERQEYRETLREYGVRYKMDDIYKFPKSSYENNLNYKKPSLNY